METLRMLCNEIHDSLSLVRYENSFISWLFMLEIKAEAFFYWEKKKEIRLADQSRNPAFLNFSSLSHIL